VGTSDEQLKQVLRDETHDGPIFRQGQQRDGSFYSIEAANDLVNRVLERNRDAVDLVADRGAPKAVISERFGYWTGKEAYRPDADTEPYMRNTYSAKVVIEADERAEFGCRVITAFPMNQRSGFGK
jgi:hypothetical protein